MRISDWSSDVCSSDLGGALADGADRARSGRNNSAVRGVFGAGAVVRGNPRGHRLPAGRPPSFGVRPPPVRVRSRASRRLRLSIVDRRRGDTNRSEEHTSELQSLMRISYAVFCLKKKKTPNKYNKD